MDRFHLTLKNRYIYVKHVEYKGVQFHHNTKLAFSNFHKIKTEASTKNAAKSIFFILASKQSYFDSGSKSIPKLKVCLPRNTSSGISTYERLILPILPQYINEVTTKNKLVDILIRC